MTREQAAWLDALNKFSLAAEHLDSVWDRMSADPQQRRDQGFGKYPFHKDFEAMTLSIHEWWETAVKQIETLDQLREEGGIE